MKRLILIVFLACLGAADAASPAASNRYRYVFLIDNSHGMEPHRNDIARFVGDTIRSGFEGWMRRGDAIGIWTFNERIRRDALPIEFWNPGQAVRIAAQSGQFLQAQTFGKGARLDLVLAAARPFVTGADALTLFIVSDGRQRMRGTPFDDLINSAYARLPEPTKPSPPLVVTRLTAQQGEFAAWTVDAFDDTGAPLEFAALSERSGPGAPAPAPAVTNSSPPPVKESAIRTESAAVAGEISKLEATPPEKLLPLPPVLPQELSAPLRIEPLRFEEEDVPARTPRPDRQPAPVAIVQKAIVEARPEQRSKTEAEIEAPTEEQSKKDEPLTKRAAISGTQSPAQPSEKEAVSIHSQGIPIQPSATDRRVINQAQNPQPALTQAALVAPALNLSGEAAPLSEPTRTLESAPGLGNEAPAKEVKRLGIQPGSEPQPVLEANSSPLPAALPNASGAVPVSATTSLPTAEPKREGDTIAADGSAPVPSPTSVAAESSVQPEESKAGETETQPATAQPATEVFAMGSTQWSGGYLLASLAFLAVAGLCSGCFLRRTRSAPRPSLISRSMESKP